MSNGQDDTTQPPPSPDVSYMDWINENKLMIILVVLVIAALIWYFWFREDSDVISVLTPALSTPAEPLIIKTVRK
jgi:hypothetical protein